MKMQQMYENLKLDSGLDVKLIFIVESGLWLTTRTLENKYQLSAKAKWRQLLCRETLV